MNKIDTQKILSECYKQSTLVLGERVIPFSRVGKIINDIYRKGNNEKADCNGMAK